MAILSRRRQGFNERLPDGRSVYDAVRQLSRDDDDEGGVPPEIRRALKLDPSIGRLGGPSISGEESIVPIEEWPIERRANPDRMSGVASSRMPAEPEMTEPISRRPFLPDQTSELPPIPDLSATDYYQMNRSRRPKIDPAIRDPQAQLQDYESNVRGYEPQNESGWKIAARTGLGFLAGGIPGAIYTAGNELLDRKQHDRDWQQGELENTGRGLATIGARRKEGLQEGLIRSQINENDAQTLRARREPAAPNLVDYGGYKIPQTDAARLAQAKELAANKPKVERGVLQREVKHKDGSTHWEQSYDNGRTWEKSTGSGDEAPPEKPETGDDNATRAAWAYKKQGEAESAAKNLRQQAASQDLTTYAGQEAQKDLNARAAEAEKNALKYRDEGDKAATEAKTTRGANATEQKIRDAAKSKGLDPDEAVKRYRAGKY